jgi:hypothetical protein
MNKRISFILTIIALATALTLTALAQGNGDASQGPGAKPIVHTDANLIGTQVKLPCTINGPSEFPTVTITNNTASGLPAGTKLFWQRNNVMKGTHVLQQALAKGANVQFSTEAKGAGGVPTAWYFK